MKRTLFTFIIFSIFILPVAQAGPHADKHPGNAEYSLATEYYKKGDKDEAFKWYVKAANKGHVKAHMSLGFIAYKGKFGQKSLDQAIESYKEAAKQGNSVAQYNLGFIYYKIGKKMDTLDEEGKLRARPQYAIAYGWFNVYEAAPKNKHTIKLDDMLSFISRKKVEGLKGTMRKIATTGDILKAQNVATECLESNYKNCSLL